MAGTQDRTGAAEQFTTLPKGKTPLTKRLRLPVTYTLPYNDLRGGDTLPQELLLRSQHLSKKNRALVKLKFNITSHSAPTKNLPCFRALASMSGTQDRTGATEQFVTCPMTKPL
jgi:hypothetical protein